MLSRYLEKNKIITIKPSLENNKTIATVKHLHLEYSVKQLVDCG